MIEGNRAVAQRGGRNGPLSFFGSMLARVEPISVADYERLAAGLLEPGAFGYYAGGAGDEHTLRENIEAYRRWQLRPRVLRDVADPSAVVTVLGEEIALPVIVAPMAYQRAAHPDGELALANGALAAGTIMCLSTLATTSPADVAATGVKRWYQLYVPRDAGLARELCVQAGELGFGALVVTVDVPVSGRRERDLRSGFALPDDLIVPTVGRGGLKPHEFVQFLSPSVTWDDLAPLTAAAGLPLVVKGIMTTEDALLACEHGAAGIVVSNHGGRQLDGVAATIDVLGEIVDAVEGRLEVLLDGGIQRGTDVAKALALGATAVLAGRAPLWGLVAAGARGVGHVLELLRAEIELTLQLLGCRSPAELTRAHVRRAP
jgi:isopentenyl diphosphate isomerase/L-lactate dehydrogenase-like FMN-dependent dehydrogenase